MARRFRNKSFSITIRNGSQGKGVTRLVLNGEERAGQLLPADLCLAENEVLVDLR